MASSCAGSNRLSDAKLNDTEHRGHSCSPDLTLIESLEMENKIKAFAAVSKSRDKEDWIKEACLSLSMILISNLKMLYCLEILTFFFMIIPASQQPLIGSFSNFKLKLRGPNKNIKCLK